MTDNLLPDSDEVWKPIIGFDNYECTIEGIVRNRKNKRQIKLSFKNRNRFYTLSGKPISRTRCIQLAFPETIQSSNCLSCGASFNKGFGANYNYCSMECAPQSKAAYAKARKEKYNKLHSIIAKPKTAIISECRGCGTSFKGGKVFCSSGCLSSYRIGLKFDKEKQRKERIAAHKCKMCSVSLTNLRLDYCSDCKDVAHNMATSNNRKRKREQGLDDKGKARKRARKYGVLYEPVKPIDVFNKTKGRCHICKRKLKWEDRGKNLDRSPEIDHLWPMSKGGHHLFENLAIACRVCNANKSDNTFI